MSKRLRLTNEQVQQELARTAATLPILAELKELFTNPKMFNSFDRFQSEGFDLVDHSPNKVMSGSHKRVRGYMIKKYNNEKDSKDQIRNYMHRVEGATLLRKFIADRGFQTVVAPQKWLYELPASFPERYLVVAEKLNLVSRSETEKNYGRIGKTQMQELATVLYYFRGLNSTAANLPYTKDDKIAFIDTERWHHDKDYLRKVGDRIPRDRMKQAEDIYETLEKQRARRFESAFK